MKLLFDSVLTFTRFIITLKQALCTKMHHRKTKQDAQLSQRDRAAGCVIVFAKSRTLELGDNDLRTL